MIPVLAVPVLIPERVGDMLASVDVEVGLRLVIAQGTTVEADAHVIALPHNIGVAAAWNLVFKVAPDAEWWAIVNDDLVFAPGDLARLADAMADPAPHLATLDGFAAFGINAGAVERVGLFDENYMPAYLEDADYEYRCRLAGVPIVAVPAGLRHDRSSLLQRPEYRAQNDRTYPANVAYYIDKWGGSLRGGERYDTPFDSGAGPHEWALDPERLWRQAWR